MDPLAGPIERLAWELRLLREWAGRPSYRELALRAHFSRTTLAEAATGMRLPTLEVTLAYAVACGGDRAEWEQRWHLAARELERSRRCCPYPGPLPLGAEDADLFFGRDRVLEDLSKAVRRSRLTVVLGASGSGKSSLLGAGLLARLTTDGTSADLINPGAHPLSLLEAVDTDASAVVIVDQCEEVFTFCADERERDEFLDGLSALVTAENGPALVIGVRSDFYKRCMAHAGLAAALRRAVCLPLKPMVGQELRAIITEPALRVGLSVDADLVATVLAESSDQVGALPLVAHALRETWDRQQEDVLRVADYQAMGGLTGVMARIAEELYEDLDTGRRHLLRAILLRLTAPGAAATGRRIERDELTGIGPADEVGAVLNRIAATRLVVLDHDTVAVAHDVLFRCWPRLREWLADDREALSRHQRLTSDATEWDRNGRGEDYLYRGDRLAVWNNEDFAPLSELERAFLAASRTSASAERPRAARRTRFGYGGLSLVAALASALTVLALIQVGNTDVERGRATSISLAADARRQLQRDPELALLLAIEAYEAQPTPEADLVLRQAVADFRLRGSRPSGLRRVGGMAATPDGRKIAVWDSGFAAKGLRIWSLDGTGLRRDEQILQGEHARDVQSAALSEDGRLLVTGGFGGDVALWDLTAGGPPTVLGTADGGVHSVSVSPDGRVASAHDDGVRIWEPGGRGESPGEATALRAPAGPVRSVAFSRSGRLLATGGGGFPLHLWDMTRHSPRLVRAAPRGDPQQVAFSPHGPWVATTEDDMPRVWNALETLEGEWSPQVELAGHATRVHGLAFSPDGARLATYGADGVIRVWTSGSDLDPLVLRTSGGSPRGVAFAPGGRSLVSVDADGSLQWWDVSAGEPAPSNGRLLAISADTRTLAVSTGADSLINPSDIQIQVWDTARGAAPIEMRSVRDAGFLVTLSPDGRRMAGLGRAGTLSLWDLTTGGPPVTVPVDSRTLPASLEFSTDGSRIAAGAHGVEPQVWQISSTGGMARLTGWEAPPTGRADGDVALSPDGILLADARDDHTVVVWDLTGKSGPRILRGHEADITGLAFGPDGRRVAAAAEDGTIRLWDVDGQGESAAVLRGARSTVRRVRFSPDGVWLVTNEPAGHLRLWRATGTGEPLELTGWGASGGLAVFTPDGMRIIRGLSPQVFLGRELSTGLRDDLVRIRNCEVCGSGGRVLDLARSRRTRELTGEERRIHLEPRA
ncbi:nSTAND1 domain-containing NTPase [Actinomadura sp. 3N407]|uniref:nSTAND1 domain-containing NTPase n=1 Tax=Actinomadura sp. 3N407 TaxID=3457423 RepID=UPI003FCC36BB